MKSPIPANHSSSFFLVSLWLTLGKCNHGIVSTVFDILMLTIVKLVIIYQHDNHVKTILSDLQ
jgi:hypothetical protein